MSQEYHPDFTAWGTITGAFAVLMKELRYFSIILVAYVACSVLPYLLFYQGVDLTNPAVAIEAFSGAEPLMAVVTVLSYFIYAALYILVLDRVNGSLNGYSFDEYPFVSRILKAVIPIILIYIITMIAMMIGLLLLIIPGLIVAAGLYLAIPAKLAENIGILASLDRSWELSKGHRLGIWGVILIPVIPFFIFMFVFMGAILTDVQNGGGVDALTSPFYMIVNSLISGAFTILFIAASGVAYHLIVNEKINDH